MTIYIIRNTGTGDGMRGTRGIGECYIPGNVTKHSGECRQTFWGMSSNIPGSVAKYSGECRQTFRGMLPNILGNTIKDSAAALDAVLLNYLLFAVDFTTAKKSTKIIVKCVVVKCYYTFCQVNH